MKRIWMSVKQLAEEFGVSTDSVYRAYRNGRIPGHQMERIIRFDLEEVRQATRNRAEAMPNSQCTKRATAGIRRRRATRLSPRSVKRGRNFQGAPIRRKSS
jgi:excisionase family DNA binding protein